ncbi:hypothetical protein NKH77_14185 [Streptomyces sp. M19]
MPLARPLTVAAQALTGVLLLTVVFTRGQAIGGSCRPRRSSASSGGCSRRAPTTSASTRSRPR